MNLGEPQRVMGSFVDSYFSVARFSLVLLNFIRQLGWYVASCNFNVASMPSPEIFGCFLPALYIHHQLLLTHVRVFVTQATLNPVSFPTIC